ncbi:MAG: hypothetical protein ACFCBV_08525 [Phycisphaerales bacterium]
MDANAGGASPQPSDQDRARTLWLRTEDVVKHRLLLSAVLRLLGIGVALYHAYTTAMWVGFSFANGNFMASLFWIGQPALITIAGVALAYFASAIARKAVPARITILRCPECDYELTELRDGRCTECNYLLSPFRTDPPSDLDRAATIQNIFGGIYRLTGFGIGAWAVIELAWLTIGAAFAIESMFDWFMMEDRAIKTFVIYRGLVLALGVTIVFFAPRLARHTVPSVAFGSNKAMNEGHGSGATER